jgi:hypothetical protein
MKTTIRSSMFRVFIGTLAQFSLAPDRQGGDGITVDDIPHDITARTE